MKNPNTKKTSPKITINEKWCKKCGICIAFCPKKVFGSDDFGMPIVEKPDECIECMFCVIRCPDFAVDVESKDKDSK